LCLLINRSRKIDTSCTFGQSQLRPNRFKTGRLRRRCTELNDWNDFT
jgi:hypothetical protein